MFTAKINYLAIGRKTFDMETAQTYFKQSGELLKQVCPNVGSAGHILSSMDELRAAIENDLHENPDLVLFQLMTFADAEFIVEVMQNYSCPILVWSVREPSIGGRLRLNSLTGGNSACNALHYYDRDFDFIYGNAEEDQVISKIGHKLAAIELKAKLSKLTVGVVGEHPDGFFFSGADELELHKRMGVRVKNLDLHGLFRKSLEAPPELWQPMIESAAAKVVGLNKDEETVIKFAKFSSYLRKVADEEGIHAVAVRCWPDFFNELGAAACSTLSHFIEDGMVSSCESDIHGVITMYIQQELSRGEAPYLGDLVYLDEQKNSVVFWHCGAGAYSLANPSTGARAGTHPNRKMGFTLEFGLKAGGVTISRLSKTSKGYRMLIMRGEALDGAQPFSGTSVEVKLQGNARDTVRQLMLNGFEPHYSLVYADVYDQLIELCRILNIESVTF